MMQQSARVMGGFVPGSSLFCDWRELDRKFEAFRLFQYADRELRLPVDRLPLADSVRSALALDPFRAVWIVEGVANLKAATASLSIEGLLDDPDLPDRAMVPLHAGMGTAFGDKLFSALGSDAPASQIRETVERFLYLCRANCRPGWEDASIEVLGLVIRCLYPHLLSSVSQAMEEVSPALRALFWHGVGRSLYFVPTNFMPIPGAQDRMVRGAAAEVNREEDRRQVLAGLCWAVALVNLPQPATIRSLAMLYSRLQFRPEFTNGLVSALLAWRHMAPGDRRHTGLYTQQLPSHHRDAVLWNSWVEPPVRDALENIFPGLDRQNRIPAIYTYRTPEELLDLSEESKEVAI